MKPLPLIKVTVQLPERGKCIRQDFEVGRLLGPAFLHVLVRLVHGRPLNGVERLSRSIYSVT